VSLLYYRSYFTYLYSVVYARNSVNGIIPANNIGYTL